MWAPCMCVSECLRVSQLLNNKLSKVIVYVFGGGCCCFSSSSPASVVLALPSMSTRNNNIKLIAVETVFEKKHTVDKIQMKSSSRSNTYVQNVKFRLYRSRFGFFPFFIIYFGGKSHVRLLSNSISKYTSKSTLTRSHAHTRAIYTSSTANRTWKKITLLLLLMM